MSTSPQPSEDSDQEAGVGNVWTAGMSHAVPSNRVPHRGGRRKEMVPVPCGFPIEVRICFDF